MKQNVGKILAVILVVALCTVFFAACVPSNPEKAEANLKEAGYTVQKYDDSTDEGKEFFATVTASIKSSIGYDGNLVSIVFGIKDGDEVDAIYIYYFSSAKEAKAYLEATEAEYEKKRAEYKEAKDSGEIDEETYNYLIGYIDVVNSGAIGKVYWTGTDEAVKAAGF